MLLWLLALIVWWLTAFTWFGVGGLFIVFDGLLFDVAWFDVGLVCGFVFPHCVLDCLLACRFCLVVIVRLITAWVLDLLW